MISCSASSSLPLEQRQQGTVDGNEPSLRRLAELWASAAMASRSAYADDRSASSTEARKWPS